MADWQPWKNVRHSARANLYRAAFSREEVQQVVEFAGRPFLISALVDGEEEEEEVEVVKWVPKKGQGERNCMQIRDKVRGKGEAGARARFLYSRHF